MGEETRREEGGVNPGRTRLDSRLEEGIVAAAAEREGIDVMSEESCFRSGGRADTARAHGSKDLSPKALAHWPFSCQTVEHP